MDSSLNGNVIRASEKRILIEDQKDMYGAITKYANKTADKEMIVYLLDTPRRPYTSEPLHDDI